MPELEPDEPGTDKAVLLGVVIGVAYAVIALVATSLLVVVASWM